MNNPQQQNPAFREDHVANRRMVLAGIGASAGGVPALQAFFRALPATTGIAFVVIMHISPEHESGLPQVLQMATSMRVVQVNEVTLLEPDHVYVIPPNKKLKVADDHLSLDAFDEPRGWRTPIDHFFRSLSEAQGDRFGVVLSGSGTDGTVGMKAIKEHGGVLMAQDPAEAEYESMPQSAIATGLVDIVRPAAELAAELVAIVEKKPRIERQLEHVDSQDEGLLQEIFAQVRTGTGHDFSYYKRPTALRRIGRRMQVNRVEHLHEYLRYLRENADEARALFKELLIGVTTFLRDDKAWDTVRRRALPAVFDGKGSSDTVRMWSVGCSTGEEAYSISMLAHEFADALPSPPKIQVFATDLDEGALRTARDARYPDAIAADVSDERLERFFIREGDYYRINEDLRETVLFATHSVLRDPPFSRLDMIICRNLMIYLQRDLQDYLIELFHYSLRPGGLLFLGGSETIGESTLFTTLDHTHRLFQARVQGTERRLLPLLPPQSPRPRTTSAGRPGREAPSKTTVHRAALEEFAPPSLLVDEHRRILHLSESAGRYLLPPGGAMTSDVVRMVRPELRTELQDALQRAFTMNRPVVTRSVPVQFNGAPHSVLMLVRPRPAKRNADRVALVVFVEGEVPDGDAGGTHDVEDAPRTELEAEIRQLRERLGVLAEQSITSNEELALANEELRSMNDEHRSTVEELETSREELHSVNEELQTVNAELKIKLDEVSQAHGDLQNLLAATDVGTLFLDRDLCIKRYTPRISGLFNIMPSDVGRPVSHLTHTFDYPGFEEDAQRVMREHTTVEQELQTDDGHHFLLRLSPYVTVEDVVDGVVATFIDVTSRWEAEEALRRSEERYRILVSSVEEYAIFMLDFDRRITTWNSGAERILQYSEREATGMSGDVIFTPEDIERGAPEQEAREARTKGSAADERWHVRKDGSRFWGSGVMTALEDPDGNLRGYAKVMRDNTKRKQAEDRLKQLNDELELRVMERTRQVRILASTLTMAEQEERRRISQVLHDDLQQLLYGIQMKMTFVMKAADTADQEKLVADARQAYEWLGDAIDRTRRLTVDLSPPVLKGEGLADALHWLVSVMDDVHNLRVDLEAAQSFPIPDEDMRVLLFQITRELLFNVVKHAGTDRARVELEEADGNIIIRVIDEGSGFEPSARAEGKAAVSSGLFRVRERVALFGGDLSIESEPGRGTRMTVSVPYLPDRGRTMNEDDNVRGD